MTHRTNYLVILLVCLSFCLLNAGMINLAYAEKKNPQEEQQIVPNRIYGKVKDIIDVPGYTYIEVDTGKKKVWAAGPRGAPLNIGDMIAFSTDTPMENFHSKSMNRDFPIIYFVNRFITDKEAPATNPASTSSSHAQIKKGLVAKPATGIDKVEGGNTISEIYALKHKLKGKTIRVRGQVTKFTAEVLGKNWIHIRDSSTLDELTVTTDAAVAIDDVIIIEGKLELDKDYNYGYVYKVILEDARITNE